MRFHRSPAFRFALVHVAMGAVAIAFWTHHHEFQRHVGGAIRQLIDPARESWLAWSMAQYLLERFSAGFHATLVAASVLGALGALARVLARARMRAGAADPFARVRAFAEKHAALTVASPALGWLAYSTVNLVRHDDVFGGVRLPFAVAASLVFLVQLVVTRLGLSALLAPTQAEDVKASARDADDFDFAAVAVTREAMLAVKGLAALSVAMVAGLLAVPTFDNVALDVGVALYVAAALSLAACFRRASRVSVGLDGIHVRGSSRSRFHAFGDLDGVRANGSTIELLRGEAVTLRLQLHGPDAARRDALVQRLGTAIARAAEERDSPITRFVNAATHEDLARVADGSSGYRQAAVSRDQLWAALEGPSVAPVARIAAAEVLARNPDSSERARFRVAAERCAEPAARARLQELLAEGEEDESDGDALLVTPRAARRSAS